MLLLFGIANKTLHLQSNYNERTINVQSIEMTALNLPENSQKEQFKKKFLEIKRDVTKDDRVGCAEKVGKSKRTVDDYVNGHIHDNATAFKIYKYLKSQIDKRSKAIS